MSEEIINRIKQIRKETGLSQEKFAKTIGVSPGNVSSWESGKALPGAIALKLIHENLGYSVNWILTGKDEKVEKSKVEAVFDPDLKIMVDVLQNLMLSGDPDLRGWAKIQFKRAFGEQSAAVEEKKQHA